MEPNEKSPCHDDNVVDLVTENRGNDDNNECNDDDEYDSDDSLWSSQV